MNVEPYLGGYVVTLIPWPTSEISPIKNDVSAMKLGTVHIMSTELQIWSQYKALRQPL